MPLTTAGTCRSLGVRGQCGEGPSAAVAVEGPQNRDDGCGPEREDGEPLPPRTGPVGAENSRHLGRWFADTVGSVTRTVPGGQDWFGLTCDDLRLVGLKLIFLTWVASVLGLSRREAWKDAEPTFTVAAVGAVTGVFSAAWNVVPYFSAGASPGGQSCPAAGPGGCPPVAFCAEQGITSRHRLGSATSRMPPGTCRAGPGAAPAGVPGTPAVLAARDRLMLAWPPARRVGAAHPAGTRRIRPR
jgi:hypothetical protein